MPNVGGPDRGSRGRKSPSKLICIFRAQNTVFCDTKCVVGICECVVGFCEIAACIVGFLNRIRSLTILSTATGENRFVLVLWICNFK